MKTSIGATSDVGRTREVNEDSYLVREPLFVVADGMGGHVAGDVASKTAVETLTEDTKGDTPRSDALAGLVRAANAAVFNKARSDSTLQGMGTTCTVLLLEGTDAHLAHVGDSRAYLFRDDRLQQITEDHTLVQRMVKEGRLNQEEAHRHPQRNIITRVLGVDADVSVDTFSVEAKPDDRFLLCSDGLSSMLDDSQIEEVLRLGQEAQATADRLVELANEAGGEDNITVLVVDIVASEGGSGRAAASVAAPTQAEAPPPEPAPQRAEAVEPPRSAEPRVARPWLRVLVGTVLVLAILAAAAYIGLRYLWIERSYFVGVNETGAVTVYRGVPQDIAGMTLHSEEEVTSLRADELPEFLQDDLTTGIEVASLEEAKQRVADLEERATDEEFATPDDDQGDNKKRDGGDNS